MKREIKFSKYHGCGNDFVILTNFNGDNFFNDNELVKLSKNILNRHFGIGADQLLLIDNSKVAHFKVSIFNPDGSSAGMCGNGMRAIAHHLRFQNLPPIIDPLITLEVEKRIVKCTIDSTSNLITINMGQPILNAEEIPCRGKGEIKHFPLTTSLGDFNIHAISMGNPHCVIFCDDADSIDLAKIGPVIENHDFFPSRTNVEFASISAPDVIKLRVWERGAGATLACGSGACATLVAAARAGLTNKEAQIQLPGGDLSIRWDNGPESGRENGLENGSGDVFLTGPAVHVASGLYTPPL